MTPIRTTLAVEVELVLTANYIPGRLATSSDPPEDDEIEDIDIEDILLNGKSILPNSDDLNDIVEINGFATVVNNLIANLLTALGEDVNASLFAAADRDAD